MYIYKTTNLVTGKIYIGKRVYRKKDDNWYLGSGIYLKRAIVKYGRYNFKKEIIEWCKSLNNLSLRERFWIKFYNSTNIKIGYNLSFGGDGGNVGEEAYKKISDKLKGRKISDKHRKILSERFKGVPKSKLHIEKIRQKLLGRKRPKEVVEKMAESIKQKYNLGWNSPVQIEVHQYNKETGEYIQSYKSATEAGRILNIDRKGITNNCIGKSKTSAGFIWSKLKKKNINEK